MKKYHKFTVDAVGFFYHNEEKDLVALEKEVDKNSVTCKLELEPSNEHDPFAVKLLRDKKHIAYVQRAAARPLFKLLKKSTLFKCELVRFDIEDMRGTLEVTVKE